MMKQQNFKKIKSSMNPYIKQQIQTASPEKLILIMYDLGIQCCHTKNKQKAIKVLVELISALNFDYKDTSLIFFDLYKYALDHIHKEKFNEPLMILEELRDIWESSVMPFGKTKNKN